jgi:hypothetical protein
MAAGVTSRLWYISDMMALLDSEKSKLPRYRRMDEIDTHLRQFAAVPYHVQVCLSHARTCAAAEKRGRPIDMADASLQPPLSG